MEKTKKKPNLSTCLENVLRTLEGKSVSLTKLAQTVCEKHDPQGSQVPYEEILRVLPSLDSPMLRPIEEWFTLMLDSCSELVDVLHTDLMLLLITRHSPVIAKVFSECANKSAESIDTMLRRNLNEFIADVHYPHEIVSKDEFWELLANERKTDSRNETRGRDNAAIVYSAEIDLSYVEEWATEMSQTPLCACVPLRIRLDVKDLDSKLTVPSLECLNAFHGKQHKLEELVEKLRAAANSNMKVSQDFNKVIVEWENIIEMETFIGHRIILILELENINEKTIDFLSKWLARVVSHCHDRFIVVVGGIPDNAMLQHDQGTWAYRLKSANMTIEDVGQAIVNDTSSGDDLLELKQEINAITDAIASKELTPPLVVGICGGWGAGKSFVLDLIDKRLREIRGQDVTQKDALHVGHIYWIEFDAWTYSKKNLWASLMDQICRQFEEQLNIERIQYEDHGKESPRIHADLPPWEVSKKLAGTEPSELLEYNGWSIAISHEKKDLTDLLVIIDDDEFAEKEKKLTKELEDQKIENDQFTVKREKFMEDNLSARVAEDFVNSIPDKFFKSLGIDKKILGNLGNIANVSKNLNEHPSLVKRLWGSIQSPYIIMIILIGIGTIALYFLKKHNLSFTTSVMPLVTSVGLTIARVLRAHEKIQDRIAKSTTELTYLRENARNALAVEYNDKEGYRDKQNKYNNLQNELDEHRKKSGIPFLELEDLQTFLGEIRSGEVYKKQLGLMNQVQLHLQKLSRLVTGWSNEQEKTETDDVKSYMPFWRGTARVILKIDDLDRCPPQKVVEVLEAAQLLVKTDLFVVLLSLDLRYVTRAIEKCYMGILSHNEHPTGLDYIEKIIQLPYQVRPIAEEHLDLFFSGQFDYDSTYESHDTEQQNDETLVNQHTSTGMIPARTIQMQERKMIQQVLKLGKDEFENIVEACKPLNLSPRAGKRISNVYKIWKLLWHLRDDELSTDQGLKRAMVALLALSTVRPRLTRYGLSTLAQWRRSNKYLERPLNAVFYDLAKDLDEPLHIQDLFSCNSVFPELVKVEDLSHRNLSLLISFSFVGDDDYQGKHNGKPFIGELPCAGADS